MQQTVPVKAKGFLTSKTILLNGLVAVPLVIDQLVELITASGDLIPDLYSKWILFWLAVINIVLRAGTTQPVASTPVAPQVKPAEAATPGTPPA